MPLPNCVASTLYGELRIHIRSLSADVEPTRTRPRLIRGAELARATLLKTLWVEKRATSDPARLFASSEGNPSFPINRTQRSWQFLVRNEKQFSMGSNLPL